jgi:hypothetical protein
MAIDALRPSLGKHSFFCLQLKTFIGEPYRTA